MARIVFAFYFIFKYQRKSAFLRIETLLVIVFAEAQLLHEINKKKTQKSSKYLCTFRYDIRRNGLCL
jgi:hypothetical protein